MKRIENFEKDFEDCEVWDCNLKDIFCHKFYIVYNKTLNEIRFMNRYRFYKDRRSKLDKKGYTNIIIPKWYQVIDITDSMYKRAEKLFPDAKLPYKGMMNIY